MNKLRIIRLKVAKLKANLFGKDFSFRVEYDNTNGTRIFIQVIYMDKCRTTGEQQEWHGRKWYLSDHMTTDEVIKTCYAAFKAAVEHEVMEGFTVDGTVLFNPHVSYEELLKISNKEVRRS